MSTNCGLPASSFLFLILLCCFPGHILAAVVTLHSIQIYTTHEWLKSKPTVYFQCKGENQTILPDVTRANTLYTFNGEESWQPLTELSSKKCKRCGFFEKDFLPLHDVFDEWELCPSDFTASDGKYTHIKEKELNATFFCPTCVDLGADTHAAPSSDSGGKGTNVAIYILISAAVTVVVLLGFVGVYKYWQKRKRQKEQARFLKLFEDHDDMEDELGLGEII